jgi:hypothetical protein
MLEFGQGRTLALGGRIVRFSTDQNLRVGQKIRMELTWPGPLDGTNVDRWVWHRGPIRAC